MPYDCFLSYTSPDLAHAQKLHELLTGAGFSVWFDKVHLRERDGTQWHAEIEAGCEESRIVLPILTPRWKLSEWTRYETYGAEAVIPILAEGTWEEVRTPPLARWQSHLVTGPLNSGRLIASIRALLEQPAPQKSDRVAHLRFRPTPYFVGRERELDEIHEKLFSSPVTVLTQGHVAAVTALGGVGKTTLARQYAEKFWRCYREMHWVDCRLNLDGEFARIHDILRPAPQFAELKDADKATWVRSELNQTGRPQRLLIFENAESEEAVLAYVPKTGNCHTLITSRFAAWSQGIETCPVWVLEPEQARTFLLRRAGRDDAAGAEELAKKLEYLPLALEQAAAYVLEQGVGFGFGDYLRLYGQFEAQLLAAGRPGATEYPDSVFLTWRATIDKLPEGARSILRLCSFLAPAPIPVEMLVKGASWLGIGSAVPTELEVREWKTDLARYSMVQLGTGDTFAIHGLVQAVERGQVAEGERPGMFERCAELIMAWVPCPSDEFRNWPTWRVAEPHAWSLWEAMRGGVSAGLPPLLLKEFGGYLMMAQGAYRVAEPLLEEALRCRERLLGAEHPDTLASVNNLALLYANQGRHGEAEPLLKEALRDSERVLGAEHRTTLASVNNLALLYRSQGRHGEAEPLSRRALRDCERLLGAEHPDTLRSVNNHLASLYYSQGRHGEAEPLFQRALGDCERVLGVQHPDTLRSVNNLATLYYSQGRYGEAEPLFRRALRDCERVLGAEHPDTLFSVNNLASLHYSQKRYTEAEPLFQRALRDRERVLGAEHPDTLGSVNNLAGMYHRQGRHTEAEPLFQRALRDRERLLGAEHPDTLSSVNNLAALYDSQGRYGEAEPLYERALRDRERLLGGEHPDTLASLNNLAALYYRQGRYGEAAPLHERAVRGAEKVLGPEHPSTLLFKKNLALLRATSGKAQGGSGFLRQIGDRVRGWFRTGPKT